MGPQELYYLIASSFAFPVTNYPNDVTRDQMLIAMESNQFSLLSPDSGAGYSGAETGFLMRSVLEASSTPPRLPPPPLPPPDLSSSDKTPGPARWWPGSLPHLQTTSLSGQLALGRLQWLPDPLEAAQPPFLCCLPQAPSRLVVLLSLAVPTLLQPSLAPLRTLQPSLLVLPPATPHCPAVLPASPSLWPERSLPLAIKASVCTGWALGNSGAAWRKTWLR